MSVDESVEQASLRRIREQTREVDACESRLSKAESVYQDAKNAREIAKEALMQSLRDLRDLSREETIGLPLFPALRDEPLSEAADMAEVIEGGGGWVDTPASRDETTFLSTIGVNATVVMKLGAFGIQTVHDLRVYLSYGNELSDLEGIETKDYKHIMGKLKKWDEGQAE